MRRIRRGNKWGAKDAPDDGWEIRLPECCGGYTIFLDDNGVGKGWTKTGTDEAPTLNPSVICNGMIWGADEDIDIKLHFYVRNGIMEHLGDSHYPNEKIPLPPVDKT